MTRPIQQAIRFLYPASLQGQMFILVFLVVFGALFVSGAIFTTFIGNLSKAEIGRRALDIGHTIAMMPIVHTVLQAGSDPQGKLAQLAGQVRKRTGAQFMVIADRGSRRFSHPDPEKIGKRFVGGDETIALDQGRAYVSEAVGTLGPSLRSIVPIFNDRNMVIGFVSVGYLQTKVLETVKDHQREPATLIFMLFVVVLLGATGIARYVKKQTLGLEPREISALYLERQAILESIRDGIIAVGEQQDIRLINQAALEFCRFDSDEKIIGTSVDEVFGDSDFKRLLQPHPRESFREVKVDGQALLLTTVPIKYQGRVQGMVASFRRLEDFQRLQAKLRQTQQFSEMLRVQAHEYSNKLHTLAGLLQMGAYPEAIELITRESSGLQSLIAFLNRAVPHPALAAIIMGKYNRALEMKVDFLLNPDSTMVQIPEAYDQDKLVSILGNLLDNALEASLRGRSPACTQLFMTDMGHDLIFEVEDSGPGVSIELQEKIFSKGFSSKKSKGLRGELHGVGLYLVARLLIELKGQLTISTGDLGGALFTLSLPNTRTKKDNMDAIRVLIVEDDTRIAEMHRFFVGKVTGFTVAGIAQNLGEARELVKLLVPDLLLLDLYMPDGNGMEILHQLRGEGKAIDVILITAAKHVADVQQAMRAGAFDYLVKPVIFSRFEQALDRFRQYHGQLQQTDTLEQRDIDALTQPIQVSSSAQADSVPKGIDVLTLGKVQQVFQKNNPNGLSAEEAGERIGASRSTARRYLEYMITTGELRADLIYGSVGRPERRYFPQAPHER